MNSYCGECPKIHALCKDRTSRHSEGILKGVQQNYSSFLCRKSGQDDQFLGNEVHERLSLSSLLGS